MLWSHPSWVCGLKQQTFAHAATQQSHTLRGCVDWNNKSRGDSKISQSHTLRGCVDWNFKTQFKRKRRTVTPFVGVWIETFCKCHIRSLKAVTPFVGVWIETIGMQQTFRCEVSHPSWVCGLKLRQPWWLSVPRWVTPFVGVWIETCLFAKVYQSVSCHTLRGCVDWNVNGLGNVAGGDTVTPFVGVWIETVFKLIPSISLESHPSWVCGLKHIVELNITIHFCHTLRGCVDWNKTTSAPTGKSSSHTLRGCVDWNL